LAISVSKEQRFISFRENYSQGVENYYNKFGAAYRNPHEATLRRVFPKALAKWKDHLTFNKILDLACGSGEMTIIVQEWTKKTRD
jgi:ubiquinone/menaquinone biosynthesis C-methylase UbiE